MKKILLFRQTAVLKTGKKARKKLKIAPKWVKNWLKAVKNCQKRTQNG
jgi:hypothetical protein